MSQSELEDSAREFTQVLQQIVNEVASASHAFGFTSEGYTLQESDFQPRVVSVRPSSLEIVLDLIRATATSEIGQQVIAGIIVSTVGAAITALFNIFRRKKEQSPVGSSLQPSPVVVQTPSPMDISNYLAQFDERYERIVELLRDGSITIRELRTRRWSR